MTAATTAAIANARPARRHDIDALRAIAFALLILYHWGMLYVGGEDWGWHLKSAHASEWLQLPMLLVNRWRMLLIFLVSGLSLHFLLRGLGPGRFVLQRTRRLLLPLVFGMLVVVPIQPYAQGVSAGVVEPGFWRFLADYLGGRHWPGEAFDGSDGLTWNHLWYLAYLWLYTLALVALLPLLRRLPNPFARLRGGWLLALPALPWLLATFVLQPIFGTDGDPHNDWYRHAMYFTAFLYGWWLAAETGVWGELLRLRWLSLGGAAAVFAAYAVLVFAVPENVYDWHQASTWTLRNAYIWLALCALLGWGHALLNRPFRWLPWANEAVYPWYVLHQSMIILCAYWLLPLQLGPLLEASLVLGGTVAGCWIIHALIRRSSLLRPCFGMKPLPGALRIPISSPASA